MAAQSSAMFGWSWSEVSVLGSQLFGRALMQSCGLLTNQLAKSVHLFTKLQRVYMCLLANRLTCKWRTSVNLLTYEIAKDFFYILTKKGLIFAHCKINYLHRFAFVLC